MNLKALTNLLMIGMGILLIVGVVMFSFTMRPMAEEAQIQELIRQAKDSLEEGNFAAAMRNLSVAVKAAPNRPDIRKALAEAYLFNGQPLQAMAEMKKSVEISPMDFEINQAYGEALEDLDTPQAALAFYGQMINKFPNQLEPRARAAGVHEELGQPKLAEKIWEEASRGDADDDTPFVRWGQLLAATGDTAGALKIFKKGLARMPNSALLHFNTAALLSVTGKPKEALAELQQAAKLDKDIEQLVEQLGLAQSTTMAPMHVVSLRENADGAFYVPSLLDGMAVARMIVDEKVKTTLVSTPLAKRLGVNVVKFKPVNYRTAALPEYKSVFNLKSVKVATTSLKEVAAGVYNPSADEHNAPKDGTLGLTFLGRYKFTIDPHHHQLILLQI